MDQLRKEDGGIPFVLTTPQIAEVARRAAARDDLAATFTLAVALAPFDPDLFASSRVRGFDAERRSISMANPSGECVHVGIGRAACAVLSRAVAGRTKGFLFADAYGEGLWADRDAEDHANELLSADAEGPLPFRFTFRSMREGAFAAMIEERVPEDAAMTLAGLGRPAEGGPMEAAIRQALHRDASDWWARRLGLVVCRGPRVRIRSTRRRAVPTRGRSGSEGAGA